MGKKTPKSIMFASRLSEGYDDERKAIEVLHNYQSQGYTSRQIITMALLELGDRRYEITDPNQHANQLIEDLVSELSNRLRDMLGNIGTLPSHQIEQAVENARDQMVSPQFVNAVIANSRKGKSG